MSNENNKYHNDTTRISKSGLDLIRRAPAYYKERYLNHKSKKSTKALVFGSAFHTFILEHDKFADDFAVIPEFTGVGSRTKKNEFLENNIDKNVISSEEFMHIVGMYNSILEHPIASKLLYESGFVEKVFNWTDKSTGVKCKCKPDKYCFNSKLIIDLKSTDNASINDFQYSAKKYRYYVQDSFYTDGLLSNNIEVDGFIFIAVEKSPPYLVNLFSYGPNEKEIGRMEYIEDLNVFANCKDKNDFHGYSQEIKELTIPGI